MREGSRSATKGNTTARVALALLATAALLGASAASASALSLSPLNGTPDASPRTQISFLGVPASEIAHVSVVGSRSRAHGGRLRAYASATGASFVLGRPFTEGERVTASALVGRGSHSRHVSTTFTVARIATYSFAPMATPPAPTPATNQSFVTQPTLHPPSVQLHVNSAAAAPGDIFLTAGAGRGQGGAMILDAAGRLVWFLPASKGDSMADLQVQSYHGRPVLTVWQGHIGAGVGFGSNEIYDSSYRPIGSVTAGNGYYADLHELQITPQGSALLTAFSLVHADLSSVGGSHDGVLQDAIVQEVDIKTGLVMFEWHAYGHVALYDSYTHPFGPAERPWDFFHINSISLDPWGDGDFIVSSRNTWAAYEIDHHAGNVLWRLGGKRPSFKMGAGTGTAWQHDVRWQPDRTLTIFDNGAVPKVHSQSRVLRERIDWKHRTVKLVARYVRTPGLLSGSQGNVEVLGNGDSFVGWGEDPYFSEFNAAGQIVFDGRLPAPVQIYRSYRFPWGGAPRTPPAIAVRSDASGQPVVYASWNGATGISSWRVLAGPSPAELSPVASAPWSGLEAAIPAPTGDPVFAVQALGPAGEVLGISHAIQR